MLGRKSGAWQPTNPVQALPAWAFVARGAGFFLRVVQGGVSAAPIVASFRQSLDAHWARTKAIANGVVQDPNLTLSARIQCRVYSSAGITTGEGLWAPSLSVSPLQLL